MSQKKLPTGHTATPVKGEEGVRQQSFQGIKGMVRLEPGGWILPEIFPYFAESIYNYEMYPDDVVVVGFPKTGTTWLQEIAWTMMHNPNLDNSEAQAPLYFRSMVIEGDTVITPSQVEGFRMSIEATSGGEQAPGNDQEEKKEPSAEEGESVHPITKLIPPEGMVLPLLQHLERPRVLKTHLAFPLHNPKLLDTCKVIYTIRNPKDMFFSYYHNSKIMNVWDFSGSFDEMIDFFVNDENFFGPLWPHVKEALARKDHPNLHVVHYERFKKDPMSSLSALNSFLKTGLSEAQLRKICDYISFDTMKLRDTPYPTEIFNSKVVKKDGGFYRKGQVGDWQGKLTPQQESRIDDWIKKNTKDLDLVLEYV